MILRGLLICSVGIGSTSLMIGTFATAIAQRDVAGGELESCAGYSGLPSGDGVTTCDSTTSEQDLFNRSKTRKAIFSGSVISNVRPVTPPPPKPGLRDRPPHPWWPVASCAAA